MCWFLLPCLLACLLHAAFVASFGPGVTLFSFVAFLPLAAVWASDPAQRTTILNRAALAASPFVLMLTGHPEYLHTQPHRRTLLTSLAGAASIAGTAYMHRGSPPLLLAAAVCLASAALLAFVDRTFPPVMGPFYSYERRSVVLSIICVTLVALQLASAQDHSAAASSSASVLPGFPSAAGPFLPPLLLMVAGYTLTVLLVGLFVLSVNSIAPASSSAYRAAVWDFGLVLSFLGAGAGVLLTQSTLPSSVLQAVGVLSGALPPLPSSLPPPLFDAAARLGLTGWSAAWHAAFAVAVTFGLGAFLHRALSRSTPLFSPIVADVLVRAPPTTKAAALTFSGSPSEATTPALLELLAARGAHATFFVTAEEAVKKRTLVMQIASAGHEVGLLGDEYPRFWTPWGVGSSIAAGQAAIAETLAPVASQVAHAADVARSQALLSAIHASHSSKQEGGRGEGLRRRRAASAAVGSAGGAAAAAAVSASDDNDGSGSGPSSGPSSPISSGPGAVASQPAWYRPADGSRAANELRAANARGLGVALWSACPYDWDASREEVAARLAAQLDAQSAGPADVSRGANGAVIALQHTLPAYLETPQAAHRPPHDVVAATAVALDVLSARGVASFVTLSALSPSIGRAAPTELFPT